MQCLLPHQPGMPASSPPSPTAECCQFHLTSSQTGALFWEQHRVAVPSLLCIWLKFVAVPPVVFWGCAECSLCLLPSCLHRSPSQPILLCWQMHPIADKDLSR